jgi:hypothetical protein
MWFIQQTICFAYTPFIHYCILDFLMEVNCVLGEVQNDPHMQTIPIPYPGAVPWLKWLVAGLSSRSPGFDLTSVRVRFEVGKLTLVQVFD